MLENNLSDCRKELASTKMKSTFASSIIFMTTLYFVKREYEGSVVAKLPFIPFSFITGISHRGLDDEDMTNCSFIFLYVICSMAIRQNTKKLLGFAPKGEEQPFPFAMPDPDEVNKKWN